MAGYRVRSSSRIALEEFGRRAAASVPDGARVLDAGAGTQPYAPYFASAAYESADIAQPDGAPPLTHVGDLAAIPVEDGRYDLVFISQVLEHLPDPAAVLAEMRRVTREGGSIWLSTPLFYEEHEQPHDFFRYTQFALRKLLTDAGFDVDRVEWLEGYLGTLGYQLRVAGDHLPTTPAAWGGSRAWATAARAARPVARKLAERLDAFDVRAPHTSSGMPKNYAVVATAS